MKIKLRAIHASPRGIFPPGTTLEVDETEARALVAGEYADLVEQAVPRSAENTEAEPARATAAMAPAENRRIDEPNPTSRRRSK
jgi:hypothetical protein